MYKGTVFTINSIKAFSDAFTLTEKKSRCIVIISIQLTEIHDNLLFCAFPHSLEGCLQSIEIKQLLKRKPARPFVGHN